jgi:putative transposase
VLFALLYLLLRRMVGLIAGCSNERMNTEAEVLVLRHQLMVFERQVGRPRLRRRDRLVMATSSRALPRARWSSFAVTPQTLLRWHRELVRRKWTFRRASAGGRPSISDELRELILRMGRENPRWGCLRIRSELAKLGIMVSATKIRTPLRSTVSARLPGEPAPPGASSSGPRAEGSWPPTSSLWRRRGFRPCTCSSRSRSGLAGCTSSASPGTRTPRGSPSKPATWRRGTGSTGSGSRFGTGTPSSGGPFDEVFRSEGVTIVKTPIRAPRANAFAERWVRTVRAECLNWMLVLGRRHLERVLRTYAAHYNRRRPHRGLGLNTPDPRADPAPWRANGAHADGAHIRTRDLLGGLIHEYDLVA